jgi:TolA-binding protein
MVKTSSLTRIISILMTCLIMAAVSPVSYAQDNQQQQKRETKKTPTMSEAVYKKLLEAQELIEAKQYDQGLAVLRQMEADTKISSYGKVQVFNFMAYTFFTLEQYQDALSYYEKVMNEPDVTEGIMLNTLYTVAQLYFVMENYPKAVEMIDRWFATTTEPSLNAYMLKGQALYQMEKYREALSPLLDARKMLAARSETPKEILLLLLQNIYLQVDDYPKMIEILRELVVLYPKAEHWRSLSAAYSELEQYDKQMAILEMLYESGNLDNGRSQMNLANLYLMHEAPYKAAVLIDKGMKEGKIDEEERNLQLLAQSWQQAQEMEEAIDPLIRATKIAKDGNLHVRLAQSYINLDRYSDAIAILEEGIKKGGIDRPDQAYLMLGMSQFELQKFEAAKNAFINARKDDRSEKAADDWIKYVESEMSRKQQIESSFKARRS